MGLVMPEPSGGIPAVSPTAQPPQAQIPPTVSPVPPIPANAGAVPFTTTAPTQAFASPKTLTPAQHPASIKSPANGASFFASPLGGALIGAGIGGLGGGLMGMQSENVGLGVLLGGSLGGLAGYVAGPQLYNAYQKWQVKKDIEENIARASQEEARMKEQALKEQRERMDAMMRAWNQSVAQTTPAASKVNPQLRYPTNWPIEDIEQRFPKTPPKPKTPPPPELSPEEIARQEYFKKQQEKWDQAVQGLRTAHNQLKDFLEKQTDRVWTDEEVEQYSRAHRRV